MNFIEQSRGKRCTQNELPKKQDQTVRGNGCSKERSGSIVNESLKNGILILIDTSKESDFYDDFKYMGLTKFSLTYEKLQA